MLAWAGLLAAALVGSTVGGVAGFGAGLILLPTLVWAVGVKATIPTLTVAMLLGNLSRLWWSRRELDWAVVGAFLVGAVPAVAVGAVTYAGTKAEWLSRIIGGFLLASVPLRRLLVARNVRVRLLHFPFLGAAFGFLSALVATIGPLVTTFFLGYGLRKGSFLATESFCALGMHLTRAVVFQRYKLLTSETLTVGLVVGAVMFAGSYAGRWIMDRMSERAFLLVIEGLLAGLGAYLLLWPSRS
jgi:uncharacterized membrane protein YfcA